MLSFPSLSLRTFAFYIPYSILQLQSLLIPTSTTFKAEHAPLGPIPVRTKVAQIGRQLIRDLKRSEMATIIIS